MMALQISSLSKSYHTHCVLDEISLDIKSGESFGLIGLNGAGKTTLLKSILDIHRINSGEIMLYGEQHTLKSARQRLAYLPEKFNPPDFMTGMEYLRFILDAHQLPHEQKTVTEKTNVYCKSLDFEVSAISKPVKSYSKGMTQKLGIMGALLANKDLLVLDEPMSGLDPKARYLLKNLMQELRQLKKTVLFCTHILNDIESLCDRIGIIHKGKLCFVGTAEQCNLKYQAENLELAFLNCVSD